MNRLLLIVGGLLVGILAALFIVPVFVDWNRYRGTFEEEASRLLGRDVRVSGRVNLRLLPTPYIRFEKVRIADTQGNVGESLFRADDFTIWLAIGPMFKGSLEASEIELKQPVLTIVFDDKGGGNWTDLAGRRSDTRFRPSSVALNAVRVTNGTVALLGPGGDVRSRIERINGELSAAALEGPYKISATYASGSSVRELRLSTANPEGDGSIRIKGGIRAPDSGASFAIDGVLRDLLSQPQLDGEITAKLPLPRQAGQTGDQAFDVKGAVKADTAGAAITDIALSFEQDGRPQLATGRARLSWQQRSETELALSSKWLDLDRIAGTDANASPLAAIAGLLKVLEGSMSGDGRTLVKLELEQATFGGEVVSAVEVTTERTAGGALSLKSFTAGLPGASRIEAVGTLQPGSPDAVFDGNIMLRGASLSRFWAWAARGHDLPIRAQDGSFAASGMLKLGTDAASARGLALQTGGTTITGEASLKGGARRSVVLVLDGSQLDLTTFVPANARPLAALAALTDRFVVSAPRPTAGATGPSPQRTDITARVRLGRLVVGKYLLSDVVADVAFADGNLTLQSLRLGNEGWHMELRGDVTGALQPAAKGRLTAHISADSAEHIDALLDIAEVPAELRPSPQRAGMLVPLRLASRIAIGEKGAEIYDVQLDGRVGLGRLAGSLVLDRKNAAWREQNADLAVTLDHNDLADLLRQLLPASAQPLPRAGQLSSTSRRPARAIVRAVGTPKSGLHTFASLEGGALGGEIRGRASVSDTAELVASGDLRVSIQDLAGSLAAAGYRARPRLAGLPIAGTLVFSGRGTKWEVETQHTIVGGGRLAGRVEIEPTAAGLMRVGGRIRVSELSLPRLLSVVAEGGGRPGQQSPAAASRQLAWSDGAFDTSMAADMDLRLSVDAARLEIMPGLVLGPSTIEATAHERLMQAKLAEAPALGGKLVGRLSLEKVQSGFRLSGEGALAGARIEALPRAASAGSSGTAFVRLAFEGTGYGPQSIIAALKGKGEVKVGQLRLKGLSPSAAHIAAETVLASKGEIAEGEIGRQIDAAMGAGELTVPEASLALDLADGVLKSAPVRVESTAGRITGTTLIDIESMRLDSQWRVEPKAQPASTFSALHQPLPALSVVYAGALEDLNGLERRPQYDAFERELTVRKFEREVEELERLRLDDQKLREEAEKRRLEAERQRALALERQQAEAERLKADAEKQRAIEAERRATTPITLPAPTDGGARPSPAVQAELPAGDTPPSPTAATTKGAEDATIPEQAGRQPTPARAAPSPKPPRRDAFGEIGKSAP